MGGSKGRSPRLPQAELQLLGECREGRKQERREMYCKEAAGQRCGRLQEPENRMGAHVEGTAGQKEAATEELDSGIWNQIRKQMICTHLS